VIPLSGGENLVTAMAAVSEEFDAYYEVAIEIHQAAK